MNVSEVFHIDNLVTARSESKLSLNTAKQFQTASSQSETVRH